MIHHKEQRRRIVSIVTHAIAVAGATAAAVAFRAPSFGAQQGGLAWKEPVPGARAYLGDDGGGVNTVTVCETADRFRDWLEGEHPLGCQTFQHDLPTIIEIVTYDPVADRQGDVGLPIAKVHIPSRQFVGYLRLLALHPIVPSGAVIHFKRVGNESFELFPIETIGSDKERGTDLGHEVSAKVIRYDPSADDKWDLHVTILDGPRAGESGWMLSFGADSDDGKPMDRFDGAVIEEKRR
jgi:hypothetical protein